MNKVHAIDAALQEDELPEEEEKRKCEYLYIEADEDHIHRQKDGEEEGCFIGKHYDLDCLKRVYIGSDGGGKKYFRNIMQPQEQTVLPKSFPCAVSQNSSERRTHTSKRCRQHWGRHGQSEKHWRFGNSLGIFEVDKGELRD